MRYDNTLGSKIFDRLNVLFMIFIICIMIYPILYVVSVSLSDSAAIGLGKVKILPVGLTFRAYKAIFSGSRELWRAYYNTIVYASTYTVLVLFITSITAYPLMIKDLYGKGVITLFFAIPMFFGGGLIPGYLQILRLGMIDTIWAIIVPGCLSMWNLILFRTNFQQLPYSLVESAQMDGARSFAILTKVVVPLSKPIMATIALFAIVAQWNNFFGPLIYLNTQSKMPLQIYLRGLILRTDFRSHAVSGQMLDHGATDGYAYLRSLQMATIFVSLVPIFMIYPFIQKYFVKGVLIGSIKG